MEKLQYQAKTKTTEVQSMYRKTLTAVHSTKSIGLTAQMRAHKWNTEKQRSKMKSQKKQKKTSINKNTLQKRQTHCWLAAYPICKTWLQSLVFKCSYMAYYH